MDFEAAQADALANADLADKPEDYRELGVTLTYSPDGREKVQALPRAVNVGVGGPAGALAIRQILTSERLRLAA